MFIPIIITNRCEEDTIEDFISVDCIERFYHLKFDSGEKPYRIETNTHIFDITKETYNLLKKLCLK